MSHALFPDLLEERLKKIIPSSHLTIHPDMLTRETHTAFRINTLRVSDPVALVNIMHNEHWPITQDPSLPFAFTCPNSFKETLSHHPWTCDGQLYIQELSSLWPVIFLQPQKDEHILDLCAAPGSKTALIAQLMQNTGKIAAVEPRKKRFFKLKDNLKRLGVTNTQCYCKDGRLVFRNCSEQFDKVLIDAPCSSENKINKHLAKSFAHWSLQDIKKRARIQKALLSSGLQCLKPGGRLIYSTCTFAPEENEAQLDRFLKRFDGEIKLETLHYPYDNQQQGLCEFENNQWSPLCKKALRLLPTETMNGFFIFSMTKQSS